MADRRLRIAYKTWTKAVESLKAALAANPLIADPLMASAQVFEDLGQMMFGGSTRSRKGGTKRTKTKRRPAKRMAVSSAKKRKPTGRRSRRRATSDIKS